MNTQLSGDGAGRAGRRWGELALAATVVLLAACGGGGDAPTASNIAAPTSLAISGFAPGTGPAGAPVTVTGAGFTGLQTARIGSMAATFTVVSDTQLQLIVPPGAQTGRIELAAPGRAVLSATDFTVMAVPQIASIAPSSVLPGGRVTLQGSSLDRVTQVRLNAVVLPIVTQAPSVLTVNVPAGAASAVITLVDSDGTARPQSQQLSVVGPMTLTSFAPATIVTGQTLTINGTGLDRAMAVVFGGGASAPVATRTGTGRITVAVPDAASSGAIRVRGNADDEIVSAAPLAVTRAIRVDGNAIYRVAAAGVNVTIAGSGLLEVGAVTVQGFPASVLSRTATQLSFTVPPGPACGVIELQSETQASVQGGSVVVGGGCTSSLAGIQFGQVLSQSATEVRQRLVPGKETWVRVFVISNQPGLLSPTVRLTGYRGVTILGTLTMAGPATLPMTAGAAVPDVVLYNETQSFNVQLPAAWVAAGLSVRIEVDPEQRLGPMSTADATPTVGSLTRLEVVLVPVVSGTFAPTLPTPAAVLDELSRRFPVPRDRISVTVRAPYTLTSVTDGLDTQAEWSTALSALNQLRLSENPNNPYRYYYGFVRRSAGGIAGIGYVPGRAALGWDSVTGWPRTMSHELGHNFGRPHAPCGAVASPDAGYPYAGGVLGAQPLIDSVPVALDVVSPVSQTDIMGYCNGAWFSDYNYRLMQTHLETQPQAALALAQSAAPSSDLLLISGRLGLDGVIFSPVLPLRGEPSLGSGDYTLRLTTRDGRTLDHPFEAALVDHAAPPERHFAFTVVNPGPLAGMEVWRGETRVAMAEALAAAQRARLPSGEPMTVDWSESAGVLTVRWNQAAAPYLSVAHQLGGARTVVALHRQGGSAVLDISSLPGGGEFEFALSDGLNAQSVTVRR